MERKEAARRQAHGVGLLVALLLAVCLGLVIGRPATGSPSPDATGAYEVDAFQAELHDEVSDRSLEVLVLSPLAADGPLQSRPFVIFSHGFLLAPTRYRSYGERLASHGFVVALPALPMSLLGTAHSQLARDVRFVVDEMLRLAGDPEHPLFGRIDPTRVGLAGHSLGGKLSLLEAVEDKRIRAVGVLDPVDSGNPLLDDPERYPSVAPELMPEVSVPLLFVGAELGSVLVAVTPCAPEDENYQRFYEAANLPAIEITQLGVGHSQYVDGADRDSYDPCARGDVPSSWVRESSASYLTAFFLHTLSDSQAAMKWLDERLEQDEAAGRITVRRK